MDLDSAADELYATDPGDFVATRDAQVAAARQAGDKDLATAIGALRRPTISAWLVNRLARERSDELADLLALGETMRDAQRQLAGDELRRLTRERQDAIRALTEQARTLADSSVSESVEREVEGTLLAAVADPGAADAVRSGRLTGALQYSGFGPVDLTDAVATEPTGRSPARPKRPTTPKPPAEDRSRERADRRETERVEARAVRDEARAAAETAEREAGEREAALAAARTRQDELRAELTRLQERVEQIRAEQTGAARTVREAQQARDRAGRAAQLARTKADRAQQALDRFDP